MARLTSDLSQVRPLEAVPKGVYTAHVVKREIVKTRETNNPMLVLDWEIEGGDYAGRTIRFDNVILGGTNRQGETIQPFRLAELLECCELPWNCERCEPGGELVVQKFVRGDDANGGKKGYLYCPDNMHPTESISYDDDNFQGARCRVRLNIFKKEGTDRELNNIEGYLPLE